MNLPRTLMPMVILVLLGGMGTLAAGQGPVQIDKPDLTVAAIDIVGDDPMWVHDEPTDTRLRVTVKNVGDATSTDGYRIEFQWVQDGAVSWLHGEQADSFTVYPRPPKDASPLPPGASRTHETSWNLRLEHRGLGDVRVTIHPVEEDARTGNNVNRTTVDIPYHHVSLAVAGGDQPIRPHETRFTHLRFDNLGNRDENVVASLSGTGAERLTPSLGATGQTAFALPAASSTRIPLYVTFDGFTPGKEPRFEARYVVEAEASYGRLMQATTPYFSSLYEALQNGSSVDLVRAPAGVFAGDPGERIAFPFQVTNTGDKRDTYQLSASAQGSTYDFDLDPPRIALEPGGSATFQVAVRVPPGAQRGSSQTIEVRAQSDRDTQLVRTTQQIHSDDFRVHGPAIRIVPGDDWPTRPYAGDRLDLPVRIFNRGDQATPTGAVQLTIGGPDVAATTHTIPLEKGLGPGEDTTLTFPFGAYPSVHGVKVRSDWLYDAGPLNPMVEENLLEEVDVRRPGFAIEVPPSLSGAPGQTVPYQTSSHILVVQNTGNRQDVFEIRASANSGVVDFATGGLSIELSPEESRSIPFRHRLPLPSGNLSQDTIRFDANVAGRPGLAWNASLHTMIMDTTPPQLQPAMVPEVWAVGENFTLVVNASDDAMVASVLVGHTRPSGADRSVPLMPHGSGGRWEVPLTLSEVGNHTFEVAARDPAGNTAHINLTVPVRPVPPPNVTLYSPDPGVSATGLGSYQVHVEDALAIASVTLTVQQADGNVTEQALTLDGSGNAVFSLDGVPPGPTALVVKATNVAGAHANVTLNVEIEAPSLGGVADDARSQETPGPGVMVLIPLLAWGALRRRLQAAWAAGWTHNGQKAGYPRRAGPAQVASVSRHAGRYEVPGAGWRGGGSP